MQVLSSREIEAVSGGFFFCLPQASIRQIVSLPTLVFSAFVSITQTVINLTCPQTPPAPEPPVITPDPI